MKAFLSICLWFWLVLVNTTWQPVKAELATLVLFREKEFNLGRNTPYEFRIDKRNRVKLFPNRYVQLPLAPGRIKIEFISDYFTAGKTLWLIVEPGRTYYVKAVIDTDFMRHTLLMAPVGEAEALRELRRMKPEPTPSFDQPD